MQIMRAVLALGASSTAESSFVRSSRAEGRSCMKEAYARRDARRTARTSTALATRRSGVGRLHFRFRLVGAARQRPAGTAPSPSIR